MPTLIDHPTDVGATDEWGLFGAAGSKMEAVAANDGDASVIYADTGGLTPRQLFRFSPIGGATDPVTSAAIVMVCRVVTPGGGANIIKAVWNSVAHATNHWTSFSDLSAYKTMTSSVAAPTVAACNGEHGIEIFAAGGPTNQFELWCTELHREVALDFSAGAGESFAHLIGSLVGALIGSNLLLRDMSRLPLGRWRLEPHEYEPAWREWNAQKRMVLVG
jgi:hypothetical protein